MIFLLRCAMQGLRLPLVAYLKICQDMQHVDDHVKCKNKTQFSPKILRKGAALSVNTK